jgi:hypothetical protein
VIEKIVIIDQTITEGGTGIFFKKKYFSQNYLKHIEIDSVFNADSESEVSFPRKPIGRLGINKNRVFLKHVFRG